MANSILRKDVLRNKLILFSEQTALALCDPVRAKILFLIAHKAMNAEEISEALKQFDISKATSTIRHHLEILRESDLVEVSRFDEARGAVTKYYSPSARLIERQCLDDLESKNTKLIEDTSKKLAKILAVLVRELRINESKSASNSCPICGSNHFLEAAVAQALNLCTVRTIESEAFKSSISATTSSPKETRSARTKGPNAS